MQIVLKCYRFVRDLLKIYWPAAYIRFVYFVFYRKFGNFRDPKSFKEKLLYLYLHENWADPTVKMLENKYRVRAYLEERGYGHLLNELITKYDDVSQIDWDALPDGFALKMNIGSGMNYICYDKSRINRESLSNTLRSWLKPQPMKDIIDSDGRPKEKKWILCEKLLPVEEGRTLTDYKFYCFNGEPVAIMTVWDRKVGIKGIFMSPEWTPISYEPPYKNWNRATEPPEKPACLDELLAIARDLSKPLPFVRIDLYDVNGKPAFGEFTFFPADCVGAAETPIDGRPMGDYLDISKEVAEHKHGKR